MVDEKKAVEILMAMACCGSIDLTCDDCPLYAPSDDEDTLGCRSWTDEEVVEAVRFLRKERGG